MAEIPVSDEEMALRRRARRRLVGAIALALAAIVILPMLFDREPKPLGPDVDVQIPGKDTPFVSSIGADVAPVAPEASAAIHVEPAPPVAATPRAAEPAKPASAAAKVAAAEEKAESAKSVPVSEPKAAEASTGESKTAEAKVAESKAYYLQLGVFDKRENADKLVEKIKAAGFKAHVDEDAKHVRVRIGPIGDRAKAEQYAARLKAKGIGSQLISP